jgi:hypothetical protein
MDKARFIHYLDAIKRFNKESDEVNKHLSIALDGGHCDVGYAFLDDYIELLSESVGDNGDWIAWFCFDNEFGARKLTAGYDGNERPITNVHELWDLIQESIARYDARD